MWSVHVSDFHGTYCKCNELLRSSSSEPTGTNLLLQANTAFSLLSLGMIDKASKAQ